MVGKVVWRFIRDIQHGRRGLVPLRMTAVKDEKRLQKRHNLTIMAVLSVVAHDTFVFWICKFVCSDRYE